MNPMWKPSDNVTLIDRIAPISQGAGTVNGAWVKASDYAQLMLTVMAGVLGAAATLDAKIQQATDGAGTGAKDITGAAIVQMVKATDDGKSAIVNVEVNKLDAAGGFAYVRISATVAAAASLIGLTLHGVNSRYGPGVHAASVFTPVNVN